jgi:GT2 family glycosyltransferase
MRYDVVVATLNRATSLENCLSMIEKQSECPARVIIVDAGNDHDQLRMNILAHRDTAIEWIFLRSDVKSSSYQRNLGLREVKNEVVLMPDDDSMLHPAAAAEMMAGYRADTGGFVAGVSGIGVRISPLADRSSQLQTTRAFKDGVQPLRNRLESLLVPEPFKTFPQSLWRHRSIPSWVDGRRFRLVESIGGYRLSLRSDLAKEHQFDETLGRGIGYALHEDMELSIRLQKLGYLLIAAQNAPVFHDVHPGRRAHGFNYGFCWIMNYVYACRKNIPEESRSWSHDLTRFLGYKVALYRTRAIVNRNPYYREALEGARAAFAARHVLLDTEISQLPTAYEELCRTFIRQ